MTTNGRVRSRRQTAIRGVVLGLAVVLVLFGLLVAYATIRPIGADTLVSHPTPAADYAEATRRWAAVEAADDNPPEPLDARCHPFARLAGARTATVAVLIHGYTNCPFGMTRLADELSALGWNVIVPRLPHHGYADKLTRENGLLTSEDLVATADAAVDIAAGLGDRIVVVGLSAGGVTAMWTAQNRPDVDRVVAIAPLANLRPLPGWFTPQVVNVVLTAPDIDIWWDGTKQAAIPPDYGYPQLSTHAVASLIRLGMATLEQARSAPPGAREIVMTVNANDGAVNPQTVDDVAGIWRSHGAAVTVYEWPPEWGLTHNMVDDVTNADKFDLVYPVLLELITG